MALLIIFLIIVAIVLYWLRSRMDPTVRNIIVTLLILFVALWLLAAFGIVDIPSSLRLR